MTTKAQTRRDAVRGGVVRNLDELGRIVIPIEIRKRFGLKERDALEISVRNDTILLTKPLTACLFCGNEERLVQFHGRSICPSCIDELTLQA